MHKDPAWFGRVFVWVICARFLTWSVSTVHHVIHCYFVATAKTIAVISLGAVWNMRMTILIAIIDVRSAMIVVILACAFDTIMKTLALDVAKLLRRIVPRSVLTVSLRR